MNTDEPIAVLEAEIATLKFAVIALAFRLEANSLAAYASPDEQPSEVLH